MKPAPGARPTAATHPHAPAISGNLAGIVGVLVAMFCFVVNDVFVKLVGADLPIGEMMLLRGVVSVAGVLAVAWWMGALRPPRILLSGPVAGRVTGEIFSTPLFLFGLMHMPFADANAILQFGPLAVTAGSAIFLAERVGWRRWTAACVGLLGVLLIIRPGGATFNTFALLPLGSVVAGAARDLFTRRIDHRVPTLMLTLVSAGTVTVTGGAIAMVETWVTPSPMHLVQLTAAAVLLAIGYFAATIAVRAAEISVIAPFRYSIVVFAIVCGVLVWGEVPDALSFVGIGIVTAAGLYTFYRERRFARLARAAAGHR